MVRELGFHKPCGHPPSPAKKKKKNIYIYILSKKDLTIESDSERDCTSSHHILTSIEDLEF